MALQLSSACAELPFLPSVPEGAGEYSIKIAEALNRGIKPLQLPSILRGEQSQQARGRITSLEERLYDARALCKTRTASVAMYLPAEWRSKFFSQIDNLMDIDNWEDEDVPIIEASFATLLRMLLLIGPVRRPGLGSTSDGHIIAAWTVERDRLTIECLPGDMVRWVLSRYIDGSRESGAGQVRLTRLLEVLKPYSPERWFANGD